MNAKEQIESKRRETADQMLSIGSARKGTISEQYVPVMRGGKTTQALRGPYCVLTAKKDGKTVSVRLTTPQSVERAREEIANHQRLTRLFGEFEEFTERLGALEREHGSSEDAVKKGLKSRSSGTRKSRG